MKKILFSALFLCVASLAYSQDSTVLSPVTISGGAEIYYSYDFSNPANHERPPFFYSFNRHNEVNLNLGFIKANYNKDNVRGNFALMGGTYSQYNLSSEHPIFQHLLEANAGVKISKGTDLWVDAGIMPSHIGFESAIGKDCWNLSRSILAENSPYYESGLKLGYTSKSEKFYLAGMYLNGWQHMQRLPKNNTPAFGSQLILKPNNRIVANWSSFIGNEKPDSAAQWRYFNNFYLQYQLTSKLGFIAGFDIGMQQRSKGSSDYNVWHSPVFIARVTLTDRATVAARVEYYSDPKGVIISTNTTNGFQTLGYSLNFDYAFGKNLVWRMESRGLNSKDAIFTLANHPSNQNFFVTTSLAMSF